MTKKEVLEIRHQFAQATCSIDKICGCYVDGDRSKIATMKEAFLSLPEEEAFKYFEIFKKNLSGSIGKNLITMPFPTDSEFDGGTQEFLLKLRNSKLEDDELIDQFYDKVIENYDYTGNYLILLIHDTYDVPGKTTDGLTMDDASDEIYEYIMCCICHVNLSKAGLSYFDSENTFHNRIRDWIVDVPDIGFLFPAFIDRTADIHNVLYYTKKPEEIHEEFIRYILGTGMPVTAGNQKEAFQTIITKDVEPAQRALLNIVRMHCGQGNHSNVIEQSAVMGGSMRTFDKGVRQLIIARMDCILKQLCEMHSCTYKLDVGPLGEPIINDSDVVDAMEKAGQRVVGEDMIYFMPRPELGTDDFSYYRRRVPKNAYFYLGSMPLADMGKFTFHESNYDVDPAFYCIGTELLVEMIDELSK